MILNKLNYWRSVHRTKATRARARARLEMLRQFFLTGLDEPLKNKLRYKEFKDYIELVRETDKYDNRIQAEKEESSKQEFVNAVTSTVSPSDSQLLWAAIDNIRNKQSETVGAIASTSRPTAGETEPTISSSGFDMLAKRLDEVIKSLNNARQPVQRPPKQLAMATQPATVPPIQVAYQPNFQGPPFHPPPQHQPTFNHIYRPQPAFCPQTRPPAPSVTCNFCGHKGHYESHCRKKEAARAAAMSRTPHPEGERDRMITCHTCGVVGHLSTTCPNGGSNIPGPLNGQGNA